MRNIYKDIPNLLTLGNLAAGCWGIVMAFGGEFLLASYAIWLAGLFDFLDGFVARMLKVASPIGKELDSLADMVTFGVLPSVMVFNMVIDLGAGTEAYLVFLIAIFSALRLAKFNTDERQAKTFIGVPTPALAFFVSGVPFWALAYPELISGNLLIVVSIVMALLLVAPFEMLALKFDTFKLKDNVARYLLIIGAVVLIVFLKTLALPIIILYYIFLSVGYSLVAQAIK